MQFLGSKGFTLIEVMVAMAIFAIGILGVSKLNIMATGGNTISRKMTEAAYVALDDMEKLILLPYDILDVTMLDSIADTKNGNENNLIFPGSVSVPSGVSYTINRSINSDTPRNEV